MIRILAILLVLLSAAAGASRAADGETVVAIRVTGLGRVDERQLLESLRTRVGLPLSARDVQEDVKDVYRRFGARMTVVAEEVAGGVRLDLHLEEEPLVAEVRVEGVDAKRAEELLEEVGLAGAHRKLAAQVRERVAELERRLREEGRWFASVALALEPGPVGTVAVVTIDEGPRVEVDAIRFEGLRAVDPDRARDVMTTKPTRFLVFKGYLRADVLERDVVEVERFLRAEGLRDARVALDRIDFSDDREEATVVLAVDEGPLYRVEAVEFRGNASVPEAALREVVRLVPGEPLRDVVVANDRRRILELYGARGHVRARVEPDVAFAADAPRARVTYVVEEGDEKRVRDVVIRGNATTRDEVIRREITLEPGEVASTAELRKSVDRLRALGYFADAQGRHLVDARFESTADPLLEDLVVDVEEARAGRIFFTVGASTDTGFFAGVQLEKDNFDLTDTPSSWNPVTVAREIWRNEAFHGGGQRLVVQILPGNEVSSYRVRFVEPYLTGPDERPVSLEVDLYASTFRLFDEFREDRIGVATTFAKRLDEHWSVGVTTRAELVDIGDLDDAPDDVEDVEGTNFVPSIGPFVRYRDYDRLVDPTEGYEAGLRWELLAVDAPGQRVVGDAAWLVPVHEDDRGRRHVLALRGAAGVADGFGGELPFFERLQGGGASGDFPIRGFAYRGVGPEEDDVFLGGGFGYAGSVEYRFPIWSRPEPLLDEEREVVRGVVFLDVGSIEDEMGELIGSPRVATGVGLRILLPVLGGMPIGVDLGLPLVAESDDEIEYLSLRVSTRF